MDKTSDVLPALVKVYDYHKIYELSDQKKPMAKDDLSQSVVELMGMDIKPDEAELIADVMIGLMRQAEKDLRIMLSERLSVLDTIPLRLALHVANDEIEIADPFLRNCTVFSDMDLIYIIKSKGPEYWRSIACRKQIGEQTANVLASTKDNDTVQNLVKNNDIVLPETAFRIIGEMAEHSESLADSLLHRADIPSALVSKLYNYVGQDLKNYINQHHQIHVHQMVETLDDVIGDLQSEAEASSFTPTPSMIRTAEKYKAQGELTLNYMLDTLRRGQMQSFIAQMSVYCSVKPAVLEEVLKQKNGQGLAVIAKALGIQRSDFLTIFLLTNRMRDKGRYVDSVDMNKAIGYYTRIDLENAQRILRSTNKR